MIDIFKNELNLKDIVVMCDGTNSSLVTGIVTHSSAKSLKVWFPFKYFPVITAKFPTVFYVPKNYKELKGHSRGTISPHHVMRLEGSQLQNYMSKSILDYENSAQITLLTDVIQTVCGIIDKEFGL